MGAGMWRGCRATPRLIRQGPGGPGPEGCLPAGRGRGGKGGGYRRGAGGGGEAAITGAGNLRARYVIHAASMSLGGRTTRVSLKSSMQHVFRLAHQHEIETIAVPAVGTGIAGFAIDECGRVMAECLNDALSQGWQASEVRFVLFGEESKRPFETAFWNVFRAPGAPAA